MDSNKDRPNEEITDVEMRELMDAWNPDNYPAGHFNQRQSEDPRTLPTVNLADVRKDQEHEGAVDSLRQVGRQFEKAVLDISSGVK